MSKRSDSDRPFRVAVFGMPDDPDSLADVLEDVLGLHATDARVHARAAPGVLGEPLDRETADRLASAIGETGVQAEVLSASDIPSLAEPVVAHHARCLDVGLEVSEMHGRAASLLAWNRLDLLSVGQIPQETERYQIDANTTSISSARRAGGRGSVKKALPPGPEAWIIAGNPFRAYRIDHKRMNYEYLGDRKTDSATSNFRMFCDDLVAHARLAYLTPATRAWLEHGSVEDYSFTVGEALERYTVLHLLLHRRAQNQASGAASAT